MYLGLANYCFFLLYLYGFTNPDRQARDRAIKVKSLRGKRFSQVLRVERSWDCYKNLSTLAVKLRQKSTFVNISRNIGLHYGRACPDVD